MANENMIQFLRGNVANLPQTATSGALYFTKDEGVYLGLEDGSYHRYGDFIIVADVKSLPTTGAHETCMYYCASENILARYDSEEGWVQINKQPTAEEMKTLLGLGSAAYTDATAYDEAGSAEAVRTYVGEIPESYTEETIVAYINKKAEETLNAASGGSTESAASVLAALNTYKSENDPKVTANTNAIAAIKDGTAVDSFADVETELAKKVDKVEGKSLVSDTEITKLAGVSEGANKVEKSDTNGNIKVDGAEVVVYTHPEKHAIADVDGLQDALDGKQAAGDYAAEEHTHVASDITDFATEVAKVKVADATNADVAAKVANAVTVKVGGADVVFDGSEAKTADVDAAIEAAINAIPAQTDYTVTIAETTDGLADGIAKKYTFTQNGAEIGSINLAKELVVTSGSVKEVTEADAPYAGAVVGDKYIELVIANQDAPIYVPAKDLVDIYTAKDGGAEVQVAISNTNEISATLVNGGITEEKFDEAVKTKLNKVYEEVGVAKALVDALADGQVKTNKEAIEAINNTETGILKQAKDYADGLAGNYAEAEHTHTASEITDFATEVAKVKVNEAAKADEATKATQDGNGKVIADTYAEKATTLAGYGIGDAYTKTETEALLTWGEF